MKCYKVNMFYPTFREHIIGHLEELKESVSIIDVKTSALLVDSNMSAEEIENMTEDIDEETHKLQYKVSCAVRSMYCE